MDDQLETWWARMATPMAGAKRGIQFMPEVNDEVLVAFDRGDRGRPYVVGGLWNGKDAPPLLPSEHSSSGQTVMQQIKTRTGHILQFSETSGSEHVSVLRPENTNSNSTTAKEDPHQIQRRAIVEIDDNSTGKITIKSGGDVMVEAGGKVTVKATMDAAVEGMNVSVKATGKLELSGATVKVSATGMLDLESTGITSVKGSLVKIN
jgi:uncharacterized protein involved in type VI secretion and phage assembly